MTPLCQITRNGGCPSRTADQIWKSPTGCAILKSQISTSPHQKVRRIPVFQTRHSLPLFPLPLPLSLEGFPKGRNRSFAPLCRFKGVRGEIEIPPRFSLGGWGDILFSKENIPLASPYRNGTFCRESENLCVKDSFSLPWHGNASCGSRETTESSIPLPYRSD